MRASTIYSIVSVQCPDTIPTAIDRIRCNLLSCLSPACRGDSASHLLRILTLLVPGAALLTTPTYQGGGPVNQWSPPAVPGRQRNRPQLTLAHPSRYIHPLQPKAEWTKCPRPFPPSPVYSLMHWLQLGTQSRLTQNLLTQVGTLIPLVCPWRLHSFCDKLILDSR